MDPTLDRPVAAATDPATDPAAPEPAAATDAVASVRGLRLSLARGGSRAEVLEKLEAERAAADRGAADPGAAGPGSGRP